MMRRHCTLPGAKSPVVPGLRLSVLAPGVQSSECGSLVTMLAFRRTLNIIAFVLGSLPAALLAQADRISGRIDPSRMVALKGNVHPNALKGFDQGPADPGMVLNYVTLTFKTSASQQADLDQLLKDQQDPFSPHFREWLTPGSSMRHACRGEPGDLAKVAGWMRSEGFDIIATGRGGRVIAFNATVQQIQSSLHTEIHHYLVDGVLHFANATEPSVPEAIQSVVIGFDGLHDFQARHLAVRPLPSGPTANATVDPKLAGTSNGTGGHQLSPGDIWQIYNITPIINRNITGAGQKIVIIRSGKRPAGLRHHPVPQHVPASAHHSPNDIGSRRHRSRTVFAKLGGESGYGLCRRGGSRCAAAIRLRAL